MNLAQAMSSLQYAGRNPTWNEYLKAAPCEQRAIVERWRAIMKEGDWDQIPVALARIHKAHALAAPAKIFHEDAMQGDWDYEQFRKEMGYSTTDDASYR